MKIFKSHVRTPIGQAPPTCTIHEDVKRDIYCYTCKEIICVKCFYEGEHRNHSSTNIKEHKTECLQDLQERKKIISSQIETLSAFHQELENSKSKLKVIHSTINYEIENETRKILKVLKKRKKQLIEQSKQVENQKCTLVDFSADN
jgi:predicted nuclease with TOPRIM domain